MKVCINFSPFIVWQLDKLIPAYGSTRAEVLTFIVQHWLSEHGTEADAYAKRVMAIMDGLKAK